MEPSLSCEDQADPPKSTNGESSAASSSQFATLLEGLRKHYSPDDNPPFATEKPSGDVGYQAGSVQELVLATDDGRYPEAPVQRAQVVYRCWNDRCIFGTVELNGLLHIVTSFGGGVDNGEAGGAAFKHWLGPQDGFSSLPIAFEDIGPMPAAAQNQKASKSVSPSGQASKESARHISRASNQLRRSESGKSLYGPSLVNSGMFPGV